VVLHPADLSDDKLPRPAIRPYPVQYCSDWTMRDGTPVEIRPIRPEDEPMLVRFHQTLSEHSVRLRYFHPMKLSARTTHERLTRVCFNDYDRELALVATKHDPKNNQDDLLAVARLSKLPGGTEAEFALLVSDVYQRKGLGTKLLEQLLQVARDEKLTGVSADILADNHEMQRLCERQGFKLTRDLEDGTVKADVRL
jgi:acetyltransferase